MTVKEASQKWNISERIIREYCKAGIIPMAEKVQGRWVIPDGHIKPPATKHVFIKVIQNLIVEKNGAKIDYSKQGINNYEEISEYLSAIGFISKSNSDKQNKDDCSKALVTSQGYKLLPKSFLDMYNLEASAKVNIPFAEGEVKVKLK